MKNRKSILRTQTTVEGADSLLHSKVQPKRSADEAKKENLKGDDA